METEIKAKVRTERADALAWFVGLMETGMKKHDGDYGPASWRDTDCTTEQLWKRLYQELGELWEAQCKPAPVQEIAQEAADAANMLFMIADLVRMRAGIAELEQP